jgi:hypothetical protein
VFLELWRRRSKRKKEERWSMSAKNCHHVMLVGKKPWNMMRIIFVPVFKNE